MYVPFYSRSATRVTLSFTLLGALLLTLTVSLAATPNAAAHISSLPISSLPASPLPASSLADAVTPQGVRAHMAALQNVADAHSGTRAAGTPGYAASVRYAEQTLRAAGYRVRRQPFTVTFRETLAETGQVVGGDALSPQLMTGSPNTPAGGLAGRLALPADPLGCAAETADKLRGAVALVERGRCTFAEKSRNAAAAGAVAILIYNDEPDSPLLGSLGDTATGDLVPTAGLTREAGAQLQERLGAGPLRVRLELRVSSTTRHTANVIAETPETPSARVVMVGAHLDSVPAGPGINDNGSGVGLALELAQELARTGRTQGVRFAFWGAEELGLLGSEHYVSGLSPTELGHIRAYLNFDMVSSPNAAPFVYGDPELTQLFTETFAAKGLNLLPDTIGGRSDHVAFEAAGVPVAGLFSGAESVKSAAEVRRYGGSAAPYDACYHQACDTFSGSSTPTSTRYLELFADAAADALQRLVDRTATR